MAGNVATAGSDGFSAASLTVFSAGITACIGSLAFVGRINCVGRVNADDCVRWGTTTRT